MGTILGVGLRSEVTPQLKFANDMALSDDRDHDFDRLLFWILVLRPKSSPMDASSDHVFTSQSLFIRKRKLTGYTSKCDKAR